MDEKGYVLESGPGSKVCVPESAEVCHAVKKEERNDEKDSEKLDDE